MKVSIVRSDKYKVNEVPQDIILQKETNHLPNAGDMIKVGHTLSGFETYQVDKRVFWSRSGKEEDTAAFHEVFVLVSDAK